MSTIYVLSENKKKNHFSSEITIFTAVKNRIILHSCVIVMPLQIIMKSLDPLRAKNIFIRKKFGHTAVSAIKASSVTL